MTEDRKTYSVTAECGNCGRLQEATVTFGHSLGTVQCPHCGINALQAVKD